MAITEGIAIVVLSCTAVIVGILLLIDMWELIVAIHLARKTRKEE